METITHRTSNPLMHYWGMIKDIDDSMKLKLVAMLIKSVRLYPSAPVDEEEKERGFRNLAGCWANDRDDDDIEAIIRQGRTAKPVNREVLAFDD